MNADLTETLQDVWLGVMINRDSDGNIEESRSVFSSEKEAEQLAESNLEDYDKDEWVPISPTCKVMNFLGGWIIIEKYTLNEM